MTTIEMQTQLEAIYIEYFNNYLTIDKFAEHLGITKEQAQILIEIGAQFNHINCKGAK